jgi:hypothetical protein
MLRETLEAARHYAATVARNLPSMLKGESAGQKITKN